MATKVAPKLYSSKSQSFVGNTLFRPVRMGGRPVEEGDPILKTHPHLFEPYVPKVHEYKRDAQDS